MPGCHAAVTYTYDSDYSHQLHNRWDRHNQLSVQPGSDPSRPGRGSIGECDGPWPGDTISFGYDELGRRISTAINGVSSRRTSMRQAV